MSSAIEKMFGYVLLCVGLGCILFSFYSMHKVFTNAANPPEIFQLQSLSLSTSISANSQPVLMNIPLDSEVRKVVNMFIYYLFMLFILMAGSAVSGLGIQLIKEITVKTKSQTPD